jgi:ribosomal protein S18 acetylase RimI-like enzyme
MRVTQAVAFAIQPYTDALAKDVADLLLACGWRENAVPSHEVLREASMTGRAHVAVNEGRVVGFIRVLSDAEIVSYVAELAVYSNSRFQGIGRALIDAIVAEFPKARIDLLSSSLAQSFYEEIGFTEKPGYRRWPQ